jgi:hypothetical protein
MYQKKIENLHNPESFTEQLKLKTLRAFRKKLFMDDNANIDDILKEIQFRVSLDTKKPGAVELFKKVMAGVRVEFTSQKFDKNTDWDDVFSDLKIMCDFLIPIYKIFQQVGSFKDNFTIEQSLFFHCIKIHNLLTDPCDMERFKNAVKKYNINVPGYVYNATNREIKRQEINTIKKSVVVSEPKRKKKEAGKGYILDVFPTEYNLFNVPAVIFQSDNGQKVPGGYVKTKYVKPRQALDRTSSDTQMSYLYDKYIMDTATAAMGLVGYKKRMTDLLCNHSTDTLKYTWREKIPFSELAVEIDPNYKVSDLTLDKISQTILPMTQNIFDKKNDILKSEWQDLYFNLNFIIKYLAPYFVNLTDKISEKRIHDWLADVILYSNTALLERLKNSEAQKSFIKYTWKNNLYIDNNRKKLLLGK